MVRLLAPTLASALLWRALSSSSCPSDDDTAMAGAVQLQLQAAQSSRGVVAEHDEHGDSQDGALDFGDAIAASLSAGERLHAAAAEVRTAAAKMRERYSPSKDEIEGLISGMSGHVSTSEDKCTTQLYELKHKITHIHEQVTSIALEVNSTEASIYSYEEACKEKTTEISIIEKSRKKSTTKCETVTKTVKKTLTTLKADMVSMKQISSAHLHVSGGGYGGYGGYGGNSGGYDGIRIPKPVVNPPYKGAMSLIELAEHAKPQESSAGEDPQQRVERVQSMVQRAKDMAQQANQCVTTTTTTNAEQHDKSAEREGLSEDGHSAEVFLEIDHQENKTEGPYRCSGFKPRCLSVSCVNGKWVCDVNDRCSGIKPRCLSVSCVNGEWVCGGEAQPDKCQAVIIELQHVFTTAYVSLTRLIEEYEVTEHSTVCEESVEEEYSREVNVVQSEANKVCKRVQVLIMRLQHYKLELTQTIKTEHTMEHSVQVTGQECGSLTETTDYFTEVTDTLTALGNCPGLNGVTFSLPTWTGGWATFTQKPGMSDKAIDATMAAMCRKVFGRKYGPSVRAAETAELDEQSVQRMPKKNTAGKALMGGCPMCEGRRNRKYAAAHRGARVCWDDGDVIRSDKKRVDCNSGQRAALCVYEPTAEPVNPAIQPPVYPPVNPPVEPVRPVRPKPVYKPYPQPLVNPKPDYNKPYPQPLVNPKPDYNKPYPQPAYKQRPSYKKRPYRK